MSCSSSDFSRAAFQRQLSFLSPAKINLFFRVLYKRDDGSHEVASLYQAINLCDTLSVAFGEQDRFTCSNPALKMDEHNLVMKALSIFRSKTGNCTPIQIHLEKKIPMEAGLGGGSSNAATALWAFSKLLEIDVSLEELLSWGALIGSDVPFFFSSGTAYCEGRGEKLSEVQPLPSFSSPIWIAKPSKIGLSTPLVYSRCTPELYPQKDPKDSLLSFYTKTPSFYNDLEAGAFALLPFLKEFQEKLLSMGFETVLMSGSGTAFFCIGAVHSSCMEGIEFFKVEPMQRKSEFWYQ